MSNTKNISPSPFALEMFNNGGNSQQHSLNWFLEQEKNLINIELSNMIKRYDEVSQKNNLITSQLDQAKEETQIALDNIKQLQDQLSVIPEIQHQVSVLQSKNKTNG